MNKILRIATVPITIKGLMIGQMKYMSEHYEVVAVSSGGELLDEVGERSGVRTIPINMTRKISPFADLVALARLIFLMMKERPMIVHTHTPKAGILGMLAAKMTGVPVRLHTVGGMPLLETRGLKRKLLDIVEKITYQCAHKVYPNSARLMDIIKDNDYCDPQKLKVIGNGSTDGVDCQYFSPEAIPASEVEKLRKSLGIDESAFVFSFLGRIVKAKGIGEMVNAFVKLAKDHPNAVLLIIGVMEPELDPLDEETISLINDHPSIKLIPWQQDTRPYLAVSDTFLLPSYREGFPNVVMHAGAMGVPSIVSDINGCNEIIENEKNGLVVPVKDEYALEDAMRRVIEVPGLLEALNKQCRTMVESRYDQKFIWQELLKEYKKMESGKTRKNVSAILQKTA